jgi:hypothetical protein
MLGSTEDFLGSVAGLVTSLIVIGTGITMAWRKWVAPFFRLVREFIIKANRVFDAILTEFEIMERDGSVTKATMPQLMLRIVGWQIKHDERWPTEEDGHIRT